MSLLFRCFPVLVKYRKVYSKADTNTCMRLAADAQFRYADASDVPLLRQHTQEMRLHSFESGKSMKVETFSRIVVRPSISFRMLSMEE
jgi:hypothetical protein